MKLERFGGVLMYEIFERLLKEKGVTAYKISKETGINRSTFTDWKNGRSIPKQEKLQKIANYFGVSIDYLTTGKKSESEIRNQEANLLVIIRHDKKMLNALEKLYKLSDKQKEHVFELIELLGKVSK